MTTENKLSLEQIKDTAHKLVSKGRDVRAHLHELTVRALTQGQLAEQEIKQVLSAITEGVSLGASERAEQVRMAMSEAISGIDDALTNAAEAMQLALSETSAHAKEFAEQDLKQGLEEVRKLEQMLLETISRVAGSASGLARQELSALAEHARNTGTSTGARAKAVAEELAHRLKTTAHEASDVGKRAAQEIGARLATVASSKLTDIAAKLQRKADALKQGE